MSTTSRWCWLQDHLNMNRSNKNQKLISASITVIFHCLLFLLLYFVTIGTQKKDEEKIEDGVPVMLGDVEDAGGMDMGGLPVPDANTSTPQASEAPQANDDPVLTQESE